MCNHHRVVTEPDRSLPQCAPDGDPDVWQTIDRVHLCLGRELDRRLEEHHGLSLSALEALTRLDEARADLEQAVKLSPRRLGATLNLALVDDDSRSVVLSVPRPLKALVVNGSPSAQKYRDEAFYTEAALTATGSPVRAVVRDADAAWHAVHAKLR